jgi:hypothetical protein
MYGDRSWTVVEQAGKSTHLSLVQMPRQFRGPVRCYSQLFLHLARSNSLVLLRLLTMVQIFAEGPQLLQQLTIH